jgi:multiple sugar transport system ATP-binding protein
MTMGDRVAVMEGGRLQQVDTPRRIYSHPANVFVAGFIGSPSMNLQVARIESGTAMLHGFPIGVPREIVAQVGSGERKSVIVGFRPEATCLAAESEPAFTAIVEEVEELGSDAFVYASFENGSERVRAADVVARIPAASTIRRGERVRLRVVPGAAHFFSPETGAALA